MDAVHGLDKITPAATATIDVKSLRAKCYEAMNDDLNSPIVIIHGFVTLGTQGFQVYGGGCSRGNLVQSMYSIHQSCQSLFGGLQSFVAEVYRTAVVPSISSWRLHG